jgi:hypothetical protein
MSWDGWKARQWTHRSLRSTGERLSKCRLASLRIAFRLAPCCEKRNEYTIPDKGRTNTDAIAASDKHSHLFHCPAFTSICLGGRRAFQTADLDAMLVGRGGQVSVTANLITGISCSEAGIARETQRCLGLEEEG